MYLFLSCLMLETSAEIGFSGFNARLHKNIAEQSIRRHLEHKTG